MKKHLRRLRIKNQLHKPMLATKRKNLMWLTMSEAVCPLGHLARVESHTSHPCPSCSQISGSNGETLEQFTGQGLLNKVLDGEEVAAKTSALFDESSRLQELLNCLPRQLKGDSVHWRGVGLRWHQDTFWSAIDSSLPT